MSLGWRENYRKVMAFEALSIYYLGLRPTSYKDNGNTKCLHMDGGRAADEDKPAVAKQTAASLLKDSHTPEVSPAEAAMVGMSMDQLMDVTARKLVQQMEACAAATGKDLVMTLRQCDFYAGGVGFPKAFHDKLEVIELELRTKAAATGARPVTLKSMETGMRTQKGACCGILAAAIQHSWSLAGVVEFDMSEVGPKCISEDQAGMVKAAIGQLMRSDLLSAEEREVASRTPFPSNTWFLGGDQVCHLMSTRDASSAL